jgi:hypothetical protein
MGYWPILGNRGKYGFPKINLYHLLRAIIYRSYDHSQNPGPAIEALG